MEIHALGTESVNPATAGLDRLSTLEMLTLINAGVSGRVSRQVRQVRSRR